MDKARDLRQIVAELALRGLPSSALEAAPTVVGLATAWRLSDEYISPEFRDLVVEVLLDSEHAVGVLAAFSDLVDQLTERLAQEWGEDPNEILQRMGLQVTDKAV